MGNAHPFLLQFLRSIHHDRSTRLQAKAHAHVGLSEDGQCRQAAGITGDLDDTIPA